MIYGFKWDLVIINLVLTLFSLKGAFQFVLGCVKRCKPFWFVTQDKYFNRYVRYAALKCGEFSSTLFWIRGMASNFGTITEGFFKRKPSFVFMRKDFLFDFNYADWFFTRLARPGGLLLASVFFSNFVVKDAFCGYIGCFGLLDSNADSRDCTFALPSNDDSLAWVVFVNDVFSELILVKKFWVVLKWFYFLLKKPNFFPFFERWVSYKTQKHLVFDKFSFSKKFENFSLFYFPLWYISSFNCGFAPLISKLTTSLSGFNIKLSKMKIHNLFNNVLVKRKLMASLSTALFFKTYAFFSTDALTSYAGEANLELPVPFFFKFPSFSPSKKYSVFFRRSQRDVLMAAVFLKHLALFSGFGVPSLHQRFALFFRNKFFSKSYWTENFFIFNHHTFSYFFGLKQWGAEKDFG